MISGKTPEPVEDNGKSSCSINPAETNCPLCRRKQKASKENQPEVCPGGQGERGLSVLGERVVCTMLSPCTVPGGGEARCGV